jgi:hypothetical protein
MLGTDASACGASGAQCVACQGGDVCDAATGVCGSTPITTPSEYVTENDDESQRGWQYYFGSDSSSLPPMKCWLDSDNPYSDPFNNPYSTSKCYYLTDVGDDYVFPDPNTLDPDTVTDPPFIVGDVVPQSVFVGIPDPAAPPAAKLAKIDRYVQNEVLLGFAVRDTDTPRYVAGWARGMVETGAANGGWNGLPVATIVGNFDAAINTAIAKLSPIYAKWKKIPQQIFGIRAMRTQREVRAKQMALQLPNFSVLPGMVIGGGVASNDFVAQLVFSQPGLAGALATAAVPSTLDWYGFGAWSLLTQKNNSYTVVLGQTKTLDNYFTSFAPHTPMTFFPADSITVDPLTKKFIASTSVGSASIYQSYMSPSPLLRLKITSMAPGDGKNCKTRYQVTGTWWDKAGGNVTFCTDALVFASGLGVPNISGAAAAVAQMQSTSVPQAAGVKAVRPNLDSIKKYMIAEDFLYDMGLYGPEYVRTVANNQTVCEATMSPTGAWAFQELARARNANGQTFAMIFIGSAANKAVIQKIDRTKPIIDAAANVAAQVPYVLPDPWNGVAGTSGKLYIQDRGLTGVAWAGAPGAATALTVSYKDPKGAPQTVTCDYFIGSLGQDAQTTATLISGAMGNPAALAGTFQEIDWTAAAGPAPKPAQKPVLTKAVATIPIALRAKAAAQNIAVVGSATFALARALLAGADLATFTTNDQAFADACADADSVSARPVFANRLTQTSRAADMFAAAVPNGLALDITPNQPGAIPGTPALWGTPRPALPAIPTWP